MRAVHQFGQGIIKLGGLFLRKVDLLDQAVHLDAYGIDRQTCDEGLARCVVDGPEAG